MKKILAMILAAVMLLALAACAPKDDASAGTTEPVVKDPVHCICGANEGEDHLGTCEGKEIQWTAWTGDTLPTESGYYYAAHETDKVTLKHTDYSTTPAADGKTRNIVIDLNGKAFTGPGDLLINLDAEMFFTITDSSAGHTGSISGDPAATATRSHALVHVGDVEEATKATFNAYRVTFDNSALENSGKDGATISLAQSNVMNLYSVTVRGGSVIGNGGAIYNGGLTSMYDCTIYGAKAGNTDDDGGMNHSGLGGAIHTDNSITMVDCTIYGAEAGRGGAINIFGGDIVMEGGVIYGGNVQKCAAAVNMKAMYEEGASFTMKSSAKGDPVIDASQCYSNSFAGAINVDGYVTLTKFTMESGEIKGGVAHGGGGGAAILLQDTANEGADLKGVFIMNGGTITGGVTKAESGQGGGAINVNTGGALYLNGGTITGGSDVGPNKAGGVYVIGTKCEVVIGGDAKITGNEGCDVFVAGANLLQIAADWTGNGDTPLAIGLAEDVTVFAAAKEGATLTEDFVAYFSVAEGTIELADNTLKVG